MFNVSLRVIVNKLKIEINTPRAKQPLTTIDTKPVETYDTAATVLV